MNKKNIELVIIIVAFLGTGLVLYNGLRGTSPTAGNPLVSVNSTATSTASVLPYGNNLDFTILQKNSLNYNLINYPQVNENAVGVDVNTLIHPLPTPLPAQ